MEKQIKVLYIIDKLPIGGAERVFVDILNLMNGKLPFDACLICDDDNPEIKVPKFVNVFNLKRSNKYSLITVYKAYNLFKYYDILHVHMRHNFRYVGFIKLVTFLKVKVILHDHFGSIHINIEPPFRFSSIIKPDLYIGVSEELSKWAIDYWKLNSKICHTLVNIPSFKLLQYNTKVENFKRRSGMVLLGNIKRIKNQKLAIEIGSILSKKVTLIGNNKDTEYYNYLLDLCSSANIDIIQNVSDPLDLLDNYEIGICPSLSESGPLVILEYLACGLPFLCYKSGGVSSKVFNYFPEYFIDNHNPYEWSNRILSILTNYKTINRDKLLFMFTNDFSEEKYLCDLLNIYKHA